MWFKLNVQPFWDSEVVLVLPYRSRSDDPRWCDRIIDEKAHGRVEGIEGTSQRQWTCSLVFVFGCQANVRDINIKHSRERSSIYIPKEVSLSSS
jgi:hypothetical protein